MKIIKIIPLLLPFCFTGCSNFGKVAIKVIQLHYHHYAYEGTEIIGYYFGNKILAESTFYYRWGYNITREDIDDIYKKADYVVPPLSGDGYFIITCYVTDYNPETGLGSHWFEPCKLYSDVTLYFGIDG